MHVREALALMVRALDSFGAPDTVALFAELHREPSDDAQEEGDALTLLNEATDDAHVWVLEAGDLLLVNRAEWNAEA